MKKGWTYKKLGEIALDMYRGSGIKRDQVTKEGVPCVRYGEIYTTYNYAFDECVSHTNEECITSPKYFSHGDLLFAITGESVEDIGKTIAYLGNDKCLLGGDIVCMKHEQNPKYLAYALSSRDAIRQKGYGKTKLKVVHTSIPALSEIKIPIAPLDEQQRIVERLDSAFENIDGLKANAEKQLAEARTLFQKCLAKAMEPKEGWKEKKLKEIALVRIGPFGSLLHKKDYISGGIPLVNPIHMVNGNIVVNNDFTISSEKAKELSNYLLKENDIIFARRGEIGRCAIVTGKDEGSLCGTGSLFVRFIKEIDSNFMLMLFQSDCCKNYLEHNASGATMLNINAGIVEDMPLNLPPLAVQQRIVERLDSLSENVRKYEEIQRQIISECDALKQALLRKVFE